MRGLLRFVRLLIGAVRGPERVVCWRLAKSEVWPQGYYVLENGVQANTATYELRFRNRVLSTTEVPNPFAPYLHLLDKEGPE